MLKQATKRKRNDMQYETKGGIKNKKNEKWEIKKRKQKNRALWIHGGFVRGAPLINNESAHV
jgi:hypothetical protein